MLRLVITIALLGTFFSLVSGMAGTWRDTTLPEPEPSRAKPSRPGAASKNIQFYPPVRAPLPELSDGYLFVESRALAGGEKGGGEQESVYVGIDDVFYVGSIISDTLTKGIVAFPDSQGGSRARRPGSAAGGKMKHVSLAPGDTFSGYKVSEVHPDRMVFTKGGEKIEKPLYDPAKKRTAAKPARRKPSKPAAAKTRPAQRKRTPRTQRTPRVRPRTAAPAVTPRGKAPVGRRPVTRRSPPLPPPGQPGSEF